MKEKVEHIHIPDVVSLDNIFKLCGAPQMPQIPAGNRSFLFLPLLAKAKLCNQERLEVETEPEIPKSAVLEPEPEPVTESEEEADFKSGDNNK